MKSVGSVIKRVMCVDLHTYVGNVMVYTMRMTVAPLKWKNLLQMKTRTMKWVIGIAVDGIVNPVGDAFIVNT